MKRTALALCTLFAASSARAEYLTVRQTIFGMD